MSAGICVLCGKNVATTKEHVPPKGIFPRPRPSNLITVPACFDCNNLSSQADEKFMVHLGLQAGSEGTIGGRVLVERALPALKHNSKLRRLVLSEIRPAHIVNKNNEIIGELNISSWDREAHSIIIEKTIRGLFFHHYGKILEAHSKVETQYFHSLTPKIIEMSNNWAGSTIGNGEVVYKYTSGSNGNIHVSLWLFQFFNAHWAGGQTTTELVK